MRISNWSSDVCSSDLEAANALSTPLLDALSEALVRLRDSGAPVIGIRGAGKGFSAGVDLSEYNAAATPTADAARLRRNVERWLDIWRHPKPVIVAVHGFCMGIADRTSTRLNSRH